LLIATAGLVVVRVLFGPSFDGATVMILILLLSSIPAGLGTLLVGLLSAAGRPGAAVRTQGAAIVCSIPLLVVVLPAFGGVGASVVDVAVNMGIAGLALHYARRTFGGRWPDYCRPRRTDVRQLQRYGERFLQALGPRRR
jgi:O-antigen/teichoic acid export membrane protein